MASAQHEEEFELPEIVELSDEAARQIFDDRARESLGICGEEFLRKWDAGEFEDPDQPDIVRLVLMLGFMGRPFTLPGRE